AFDVIADAEPEITALGAGLLLTPAEGFDAADRGERFLQGARVIAAVIDDGLAVPVRDADAIRHLFCADHVAPAHLRRLQPDRASHQVYGSLHRERRLGTSGAAIGGVRNLVGHDDPSRGRQILDLVGAGQVNRCVVGDTRPDRVPGAAIDDVVVAYRKDTAV